MLIGRRRRGLRVGWGEAEDAGTDIGGGKKVLNSDADRRSTEYT